ncbi:MAG: TOBE domain-containing protein, partial [Proteobacteria bacterium]|nr:TOBE domain-containing protein [Pseudomonadota bacterium]
PGKVTEKSGAAGTVVTLDSGETMVVGGTDRSSGIQVGTACLLSVRPESIMVEPASDDRVADKNQFTAHIQTLLFMGQNFEADIELPGGQRVLIDLPPTTDWREDQAVLMSIAPELLQLWDAGAVTESDE